MTAMGQSNALAVLAAGEKGSFLKHLTCTWKNWLLVLAQKA